MCQIFIKVKRVNNGNLKKQTTQIIRIFFKRFLILKTVILKNTKAKKQMIFFENAFSLARRVALV